MAIINGICDLCNNTGKTSTSQFSCPECGKTPTDCMKEKVSAVLKHSSHKKEDFTVLYKATNAGKTSLGKGLSSLLVELTMFSDFLSDRENLVCYIEYTQEQYNLLYSFVDYVRAYLEGAKIELPPVKDVGFLSLEDVKETYSSPLVFVSLTHFQWNVTLEKLNALLSSRASHGLVTIVISAIPYEVIKRTKDFHMGFPFPKIIG